MSFTPLFPCDHRRIILVRAAFPKFTNQTTQLTLAFALPLGDMFSDEMNCAANLIWVLEPRPALKRVDFKLKDENNDAFVNLHSKTRSERSRQTTTKRRKAAQNMGNHTGWYPPPPLPEPLHRDT